MSDPLIGTKLQGRFRVDALLGEGGMGAVYAGENIKIGLKVAIKVLHPQFAKNPAVVARFHQEARAAAAIGHPNIIDVFDMGELEDGSSYMVLEYLKGQDWSDEIEEGGPQPVGRVASILVQVCDALQAAHTQGIVHRDLKPENIYLIERHDRDDFVKLLDFGIAKVLPKGEGERAMTKTNMMLGTAYYMSPEQTKAAKHIDHRSDIYTLGVILFQALTGYYPFDDEALPMLFIKINTEEPPPLSDYRNDLPPQIESIFRKLIAKDPKNRYQSCAQVRAALLPFVAFDAAPDIIAEAADPKQRPASMLTREPEAVVSVDTAAIPGVKKNRLPLMAGLAAVVIAGGAAVFLGPGLLSAPTPPSETPEVEVAVPATEPEAAPEVEAVEQIRIVAFSVGGDEHTGATIHIIVDDEQHDGDSVRLDVASDGSLHHFQARAEGFRSAVRRVAYNVSESIELRLEPYREGRTGGGMRRTMSRRTNGMIGQTASVDPSAEMAQRPPTEPEPTMIEPTPMVESPPVETEMATEMRGPRRPSGGFPSVR